MQELGIQQIPAHSPQAQAELPEQTVLEGAPGALDAALEVMAQILHYAQEPKAGRLVSFFGDCQHVLRKNELCLSRLRRKQHAVRERSRRPHGSSEPT